MVALVLGIIMVMVFAAIAFVVKNYHLPSCGGRVRNDGHRLECTRCGARSSAL